MPDIIKGTKRKPPVSGAGAYVDGGSRAPSVPSLARDAAPTGQNYQIGRLQGVKSQTTGSSSGSGAGGKLSGAVKDTAAKAAAGAGAVSPAVQEEIKRRVGAAQNAGAGSDGLTYGGTETLPSQPAGGDLDGTYDSYADTTVTAPEAMSYKDYWTQVGGDVYESDLQKAIAARVQQAEDAYNRQKEQTKSDYEEATRQAYIRSRLSQRNLEQQMAANGIYGGMADSQRIAAESEYQNEAADLERQYLETIADLDQAITDARLTGDAQAAEQMAGYKSTVQSQYAAYLLQKEQEAASVAQWQREQSARRTAGSGSGGYSSGGGYDNGSLSASQVAEMQRWYGASADGAWGSESSAASGGLTADEAWRAYQNVKQGIATPALRGAGIF